MSEQHILPCYFKESLRNISQANKNHTAEYNGDGLHRNDKMQTNYIIAMAMVLATIFILSLAGNIFVFLVFFKRPILLTISNRFIVNLSICNVLETIFVMPFVFIALVTGKWYFGRFLCQATGFMMSTIFSASTLTLVVIAIDRYCAVVTPLHYSMRITSRRSFLMILAVWFSAICCSLPPLIGWNRYEYQRTKSVCTAVSTGREFNDRPYIICLVTLCFILPLIIILWTYCCIFKAARNNSEKVRRNSLIPTLMEDVSQTPLRNCRRGSSVPILNYRVSISSRSNSLFGRRDEWKAAVTSCMVVSTFIICWLLYFIIIVLECLLDNPHGVTSVINHISILLAMSSSAFNPLVYVFRGKVQRVELKCILGIQSKPDSIFTGPNVQANIQRRASMNPSMLRNSPCVSRQGSEESDIIQKLHHVNTTTTLTSMVVEESEHRHSTRTWALFYNLFNSFKKVNYFFLNGLYRK